LVGAARIRVGALSVPACGFDNTLLLCNRIALKAREIGLLDRAGRLRDGIHATAVTGHAGVRESSLSILSRAAQIRESILDSRERLLEDRTWRRKIEMEPPLAREAHTRLRRAVGVSARA
jgi:hypothetical protein